MKPLHGLADDDDDFSVRTAFDQRLDVCPLGKVECGRVDGEQHALVLLPRGVVVERAIRAQELSEVLFVGNPTH